MQRFASGDRADAEVEPVLASTADEALAEVGDPTADMSLTRLLGDLERDRSGHVELHGSGSSLGDERVAVEEADAVTLALDRERLVERWRQAQGDLDLVGVDERGESTAGVASVGRRRRPTEVARERDLHRCQHYRLHSVCDCEAKTLRIALAQLNTVVGDLDGNRAKILASLGDARAAGADLVVYPELATSGYPPEDLLLRPGFVRAARASLEQIAAATDGIVALVGTPWFDRDLANACAVCAGGRVQAVYRKHFLPNYGVFDEHRYFAEGRDLVVLRLGEASVGITICEDVWQPGPPATDLALAGAQLIVNLSASPFHVGKAEEREEMLVTRARDTSAYIAFCNLVGGQDELVFDGHSVVLDDSGSVARAGAGIRGAPSRRGHRSHGRARPTPA